MSPARHNGHRNPFLPKRWNLALEALLSTVHIHKVRREISEKERADEFKKMAKILESRGVKTKDEQARKIAEDTGFSVPYVKKLIAEPLPEVMQKPPPP